MPSRLPRPLQHGQSACQCRAVTPRWRNYVRANVARAQYCRIRIVNLPPFLDSRLAAFSAITLDPDSSLAEKIDHLLALGRSAFAMDVGILAQVADGKGTISQISQAQATYAPGFVFSLDCQHAPLVEWHEQPRFVIDGLAAQLGVPVLIDKQIWGVLCFLGKAAGPASFVEHELQFLRLMAQWIGSKIEREQKEAELLKLAEWQKAIFDGANLSIIATATDGTILSFNRAAERMLGYRADEIVGKHSPQILHDPQEVIVRAAELSRELATTIEPGFAVFIVKPRSGIAEEREWTYIRKDGSRLPVLLSVTALHDPLGKVCGYLGIAADLSERKTLDSATAQAKANELAQALIQAVPDGIVGLDAEAPHRVRFLNPRSEALLGISQADAIGRPLAGIVGISAAAAGNWSLSEWLRQAGNQPLLAEVAPAGGSASFPAELSVSHVPGHTGAPLDVLTLQDISARRAAESALRESEQRWKFALEGAGDGVWDWNLESGQMLFSRRYTEMLGYAEDVTWHSLEDWKAQVDDQEMQVAMQAMEAYLDGRQPAYHAEYRMRCQDGSWKWILSRGMVVSRAADGRPLRMIGTHTDISKRKQADSELQESEARFRSIFESANAGIAFADAQGCVKMVNQNFAGLLGYSSEELLNKSFGEFTHPEDVPGEIGLLQEIVAGTRDGYRIEKRYFSKSGALLWVDLTVNAIRNEQGKLINLVGLVTDITDRKYGEESLNLLAKVFTTSGEGIVITDAESQIIAVNDAFTRLTGYRENEVRGKNPKILSAGRTPRHVFEEMWAALASKGSWEGEMWDRRKTGEPYQKWLSINAVRDKHGKVTNYIGSFTDITERKTSEERMLYLAHHDALTQLPNRLSLQERLEQAINVARRSQNSLALLLIDLDRFKAINDTLGHHIGDQLLIEVANRLTASVRETDIVARFGGDEFIVVLTGIEAPADAAQVADKIVQTVSAPYYISGNDLRTSPSIGICLYPDDALEIGDLIKSGDVAMYHAKAKGRGNYQFFTDELNQAVMRRQSIEGDLRTALEQKQFVLHYQPQVDLRNGRLVGVEALIRWQHPVNGLMPPVSFIPIAEESGLIIPLGDWVLGEACRQLKQWRDEGIDDIRMSVNLSASQFLDKGLPDRIHGILTEIGLPASCLDLEVTESMSMHSPDEAAEMMGKLAAAGMTLSIDDFGTGYSSLTYLKNFPIHSLKIDRSFVKDIETDTNDAEICDVTVLLAHKLGMEVVAEGVETEAQLTYLISIGCEKYQGYYLSRPLPAAQAKSFIENHRPRSEVGQVDLWNNT